jgi:probable F420-dependent oxidoreductase
MDANDEVSCVKLAERKNLSSAWVAEGHGGDAFSILSGCALSTKKIALGSSIVSVYVRSPPTIAMGAATVDALSRGRFILGLGTSHKVQVEPEHGLPYGNPILRMEETVKIVRALVSTGKVDHAGEIFPKVKYDLWFKPFRKNIPVYISALFPKMLELSGRLADGVILVWNTTERARQSVEAVRSAAKKAGRDPKDITMASLIPSCISTDAEAAVEGMRNLIAFYIDYFPRYARIMIECGFKKEVEQVQESWARGDKGEAVSMVSDRMVKALCIAGDAEECRKRLKEYRSSGIALPILFPNPTPKRKKSGEGYSSNVTAKDGVFSAIMAASATSGRARKVQHPVLA